MSARPENAPRGFVLWFTGMSGAGKSTLSQAVRSRLEAAHPVDVLDGDEVRTFLSRGLGYSRPDRVENLQRIGFVARRLARHGVAVLTATISPYRDSREELRRQATEAGIDFIEVYAKAPLEVLVARDVKGLYKKALAGEIAHFTGISDVYEPPENPDVTVLTHEETVEQGVERILEVLCQRGLTELRGAVQTLPPQATFNTQARRALPQADSSREALLEKARERLGELRARHGVRPPVEHFLREVRKVVVIASSSRGGSSFFAELLRHSPHLLHLRAEVNPFLVLHGHGYPESATGSDALGAGFTPADGHLEALEQELALDCGNRSEVLETQEDVFRFALELTCRLTLQWPHLEFDLEHVWECVRRSLRTLEESFGWRGGRFEDPQLFHALFLSHVRAKQPGVNPYFYDLEPSLVARFNPEARPEAHPPSPLLIEEPPFITARPWKLADAEALATRPLVIKTPSNVYRLGYLEKLFPRAQLRVLHLTRNAAASINGLYDGWRHHGFFAHRLPVELDIAGYSDVFPEWGRRWWKFDLPPGWQQRARDSLQQVCAFQWASAHRATLDYLAARPAARQAHLRLRFEELVGPQPRRAERLEALVDWLGLPRQESLSGLTRQETMPMVMATRKPARRRWAQRASLIEPLLATRDVGTLMEELGYGADPDGWE